MLRRIFVLLLVVVAIGVAKNHATASGDWGCNVVIEGEVTVYNSYNMSFGWRDVEEYVITQLGDGEYYAMPLVLPPAFEEHSYVLVNYQGNLWGIVVAADVHVTQGCGQINPIAVLGTSLSHEGFLWCDIEVGDDAPYHILFFEQDAEMFGDEVGSFSYVGNVTADFMVFLPNVPVKIWVYSSVTQESYVTTVETCTPQE